jgi:hypothetical protein
VTHRDEDKRFSWGTWDEKPLFDTRGFGRQITEITAFLVVTILLASAFWNGLKMLAMWAGAR